MCDAEGLGELRGPGVQDGGEGRAECRLFREGASRPLSRRRSVKGTCSVICEVLQAFLNILI